MGSMIKETFDSIMAETKAKPIKKCVCVMCIQFRRGLDICKLGKQKEGNKGVFRSFEYVDPLGDICDPGHFMFRNKSKSYMLPTIHICEDCGRNFTRAKSTSRRKVCNKCAHTNVRGRTFVSKEKIDDINRLVGEGYSVKSIKKLLKVSGATIYRYRVQHKQQIDDGVNR
jgi:transposase-like protein